MARTTKLPLKQHSKRVPIHIIELLRADNNQETLCKQHLNREVTSSRGLSILHFFIQVKVTRVLACTTTSSLKTCVGSNTSSEVEP